MAHDGVGPVGALGDPMKTIEDRPSIARPVVADPPGPRPRHTPPRPTFRLTVVIPSYNEPRIGDTVRRVRAELAPHGLVEDLEIVVVDDGSQDDSHLLAVAAGADQVIVQEENRGKGAAVRQGMLAARGRVVAFTDADLSYAPEQLLTLLDQAEAGWDVVVGNRAHPDSQALGETGPGRAIGSRCINRLVRTVLGGCTHDLADTQCGLKALRADAARAIFSHSRIDGFAFDVEVLHLADRFSLRVTDVPVIVANSPRSTVNVGRDAARLARDLLRIRRWARGAYDEPAVDVRAHVLARCD
jgi:dolichyl-phosphate beta-glucosyltransferase